MLTHHAATTQPRPTEIGHALDPIGTLARFFDAPYPVLLDSALVRPRLGRYSYVTADPFLIVSSKGRQVQIVRHGESEQILGDPFDVLKRLLTDYLAKYKPDGPPFQGGAIGYFGYELGHHVESLASNAVDDLDLPDLNVGFYDWVIAFDHLTGESWVLTTELSPNYRSHWIQERLRQPQPFASSQNGYPNRPTSLKSNFTKPAYMDAVRRVKQYIVDGDVYQANISQRFEAEIDGNAWSLYQRLRETSQAPYGSYLQFPEVTILSSSPEQFLRLDNRLVETRPMKGTRPRGGTAADDSLLNEELATSEKDRAENIMIVDLLRNDLGKVCIPGSIEVPELFTVEEYSNVHQMVSSVTGRLRLEHDAIDLLKACFPGGSVTGAPKIRAMEIINEIEPVQRSVYCGAIGYIGFNGSMQTSIPIRTMLMKEHKVYFQVGAGIVSDSDPEAEYQETLDKARGAFEALGVSSFQT